MRSPTVRLYIRVRRSDGRYEFFDPVFNKNRTLRPGYAMVAGEPEPHPEGVYYLRYLRGKKRVRQAVGADADAALVALRNKRHDLDGVALGRSAPEPEPDSAGMTTVAQAIEVYLKNIRRFRSAKTIAACENILGRFEETYGQRPLSCITRDDLLDHRESLSKGVTENDGRKQIIRHHKLAPRTVYNHMMRMKGFFKTVGITGLLKSEDIPVYDEPEVEAYSMEEIESLFVAADAEDRLLFEFFLATGFRDQEVRYCTWRNVDFRGRVIAVKSKPELGFRPKDKEERSVPVPDSLIEVLAERKKNSKSAFLFPGPNGGTDGHFLRRLQKLAYRAGLNCGECVNRKGKSCSNHPICGNWGLHKFRKTFATMHSEAGVPVTTIQRWLGHSDLATTLRYLAIADLRSERTRQQVNATFAGLSASRFVRNPANRSKGEPSRPSPATAFQSDAPPKLVAAEGVPGMTSTSMHPGGEVPDGVAQAQNAKILQQSCPQIASNCRSFQ